MWFATLVDANGSFLYLLSKQHIETTGRASINLLEQSGWNFRFMYLFSMKFVVIDLSYSKTIKFGFKSSKASLSLLTSTK